MTHDEMLKRLGVSDDELRDFLIKYRTFMGTLKPSQQALVKRSLPAMEQAYASFGPDAKPDEINKLFGVDKPGVATTEIWVAQRSQ